MEFKDNLPPDDPDSLFSYNINGGTLWDAVSRSPKNLLKSITFHSFFTSPDESTEIFFYTPSLPTEKDTPLNKKINRVILSSKDINKFHVNPKKDWSSISAQYDGSWIDIISRSFEGQTPPSKEVITAKWKDLKLFPTNLHQDPLFRKFLDQKPSLTIYPTIASLCQQMDETSLNIKSITQLRPEEIRELIHCRMAYEIIKKGLTQHQECIWGFAFHACQNLPNAYQNLVWELLATQLPNEKTGELESLLKTFLHSKHYTFKEIILILQTIGLIALTTPAVQGKHKYKYVSSNLASPLHLTTPEGGTFRFSLNMEAPVELNALTEKWKTVKQNQSHLKNLLELLLPHLRSDVAVCSQFKSLYDQLPHVKKWAMASFELMANANSFICMLGYRLFFAQSLLNSRSLMRLDTYLSNLPIALNFISNKDSDNKREFYLLFSKYIGMEKFSVYLQQLANRVDWNKSSIGRIIFEYIELLAEEEGKDGLFRNQGWQLWLKQNFKLEDSISWQSALKVLLTKSDILGKDKHYLLQVCDTIKTRVNGSQSHFIESRDAYALLISCATDLNLQVRIAEDILNLFKKAPKEIISATTTINLFVDAMTPLIHDAHTQFLIKCIDLLLNNSPIVIQDNLSKVILDVCALIEKSEPELTYEYWKRISAKFRKRTPAPDIKLVVSFVRRMYRAKITTNSPQPDFRGLLELIDKSETTEISPTELRKYKFTLTSEITSENLDSACEVAKEACSTNPEMAFQVQCCVLKLRLQNLKNPSDLNKMLLEFNAIVDGAKTKSDYDKVEDIFHHYFSLACATNKDPIVIDRLINHPQCIIHFGTTYHKIVSLLIQILNKQESKKNDENLIKQINTCINVALCNRPIDAVLPIVDAYLVLNRKKKHFDHKTLKDSAAWISQQLSTQPRQVQKEFLEFIIEKLPGEFKTKLMPIWLGILRNYVQKEYGPSSISLVGYFLKQNLGNSNYVSDQIKLMEVLIDQWKNNSLIPSEVTLWVAQFCALSPSSQYLEQSRAKIVDWISTLISSNHSESAIQLLKLINHPEPALWNKLLDGLYADEKFESWLNTLVECKHVFSPTSEINDYSKRLHNIYVLLPKNVKTLEKLLDLIAIHPLESTAAWRHLLTQVNALRNSDLRQQAIAIIKAPNFNCTLFSNDLEHGVKCWQLTLNFMLEANLYDREWLTERNFLNQPFVQQSSSEATPFLTTLLSFYLHVPKVEDDEAKHARMSRACEIHHRIMNERTTCPGMHRPQVIALIDQLAKSGSVDFLIRGCSIANTITPDKEMAKLSRVSIHRLYSQAVKITTTNEEQVRLNFNLIAFTHELISANVKCVDFFSISYYLFQRKLIFGSLLALEQAVLNQNDIGSGSDINLTEAQLIAYFNSLMDVKLPLTDDREKMVCISSLFECMLQPSIKARIKRTTILHWMEDLLTRAINILMPDPKIIQANVHLVNIYNAAEVIFESYVKFLANSSHDVEINFDLQRLLLTFLGRYQQLRPAACVRYLSQYEQLLMKRLTDKKCKGYLADAEKHSEIHFNFLYEILLILSDNKTFRHLYFEFLHRFITCQTASQAQRSKLLYSYLFSFMPFDKEGFTERLKNGFRLINDGINARVWNNSTNGEFCVVAFLCNKDVDKICSDTRIDIAALENNLKITIFNLIKSGSPFAIKYALEFFKIHAPFITFKVFKEDIAKIFLATYENATLATPLIEENFELFDTCVDMAYILEKSRPLKAQNKPDFIEMADQMVSEFIELLVDVLNRSNVGSEPQSKSRVGKWIDDTINLSNLITNNLLYMDCLRLILNTIWNLYQNEKINCTDRLEFLVKQLHRVLQFKKIPELEAAREFLNDLTRFIITHSIPDHAISKHLSKIVQTLNNASYKKVVIPPPSRTAPVYTPPTKDESTDDESCDEEIDFKSGKKDRT